MLIECPGSRWSLHGSNATRIGESPGISRKDYTPTARPRLPARQHLQPLSLRPRMQEHSESVQIAAKSVTSKPTRSIAYYLVDLCYDLFSIYLFFIRRPNTPPPILSLSLSLSLLLYSRTWLMHFTLGFRLCPMLNGTMKQEDGFNDSAFAIGAPSV